MKRFENLTIWVVILGLLLFSAVASAIWLSLEEGAEVDAEAGEEPAGPLADFEFPELPLGDEPPEGETDVVVIELEEYFLGEALVALPLIQNLDGMELSPIVVTLILTAIFIGGLLAMGVPLAFIYARLDQETVEVKADPEYQEAVSELEERERAELKELGERQAGAGPPERETASFSWGNMLYALLFVMSVGFALADALVPGGEVELAGLALESTIIFPLMLGLLTLLVFLFIYRRPRPVTEEAAPAEDEAGIPWATIWVIISGLIFLGIGTGLMFAVRNMGG